MSKMGHRIKERRKLAGLTQADISGPNVSTAMISLIERGKTNPSLKILEEIATKLGVSVNYLLDKEDGDSDLFENNEVTINMLKILIKTGKYSDAEEIFGLLEKQDIEPALKGYLYKIKGEFSLIHKNYEYAIEYFNESLSFLTPYDLDTYIEVYSNVATCYRQIRNYQMSIESSLQGLFLLKFNYSSSTNPLIKLKLYYDQAYSYCRINEFNKGMVVINEALDLMKATECYFNEGSFFMLKGLVYLYMKDFQNGIESTQKGLSLLDRDSKVNDHIGSFTNLGIMYREIKDYQLSIKYLEKSLELCKSSGNRLYEVNSKYEIALTQYISGNSDVAEEICEEQLYDSESSMELKIKILLLLSHIKLQNGSQGESLVYANDAERKALQINHNYLLAKSYLLKSKILTEQGFYEEANKLLLHSVRIYEGNMEDAYQNLSFI
ncbi:tetratricopeptide repeat protein [Priestia koreensis]|uniref:tetratricopeptide repeat protein n=1 Tax=Priestia koreensis TaxID=284581 RepID=UPI00203E9737|nr:tetratricopeptide repeat protein [Priestia koreensis]MCM3006864.1 tetratricopeptide repeat protein [Priestia koreensis]